MALVIKKIKGKSYYYSFLSYFLLNKSKSFSKYIGVSKPQEKELHRIENSFKEEIIYKISGKPYTAEILNKDEIIKSLLFKDIFNKKYQNLTELRKRKYDIDSTIQFTLTTLTTEEVDVDINDVRRALEKESRLTQREQISKNMLEAVESIKQKHMLDEKYLLELHKTIMASFETKTPGRFRKRRVYLRMRGSEISYHPPDYSKIKELIDAFITWYNSSDLNPIEKAGMAHYKLYKIHPFLDGNKRICRLVLNKTLLDNGFPLINISYEKGAYFDALVDSVEDEKPKVFIEFTLKQYYAQVKAFLIERQR
jgi:Fic family protein